MPTDDVNIRINAKDNASAAFRSAQQSAGGFTKSLGSLSSMAAGFGIGLGASQLISFATSAYEGFVSARKASRQLESVLKSTGYAAGVTARQVEMLAE